MSAATPRSAASAGALTNVTWSSMTAENSPRMPKGAAPQHLPMPARRGPEPTARPATHSTARRPAARACGPDPATALPLRRQRRRRRSPRRARIPRPAQLDALRDVGAGPVLRLGGGRPQVRCDDDLGQVEQRAVGAGSLANTSMPAARTCPLATASASASSSISPPRAALTMITPGLVLASASLPIRPAVSGSWAGAPR